MKWVSCVVSPQLHIWSYKLSDIFYRIISKSAHCYENVRLETKQMQNQIQKELGLSPVDKEVVVLYEGEKGDQPEEFWQGKRVVEMAKPRPAWFSRNLLQKTTQPAATTKEVKPSDLG